MSSTEIITKNNIKKAFKYGEKLVGKPYGKWLPNLNMKSQDAPFYAFDLAAPKPSEVDSASCGGFINLLRRKLELNIPGKGLYKGGTKEWFRVLKKKKMLEVIDFDIEYPEGTLLLRNYKDPIDQGHVAVVYKSGKSLKTSQIIHSYYKGILIDKKLKTFGFKDGYYTHICRPSNWLVKKL